MRRVTGALFAVALVGSMLTTAGTALAQAATCEDAGFDAATAQLVQDFFEPGSWRLVVVGTDLGDGVTIRNGRSDFTITASFLSGTMTYVKDASNTDPTNGSVDAVTVHLCAGNDKLKTSRSFDLPIEAWGGSHDDDLQGGAAGDSLFGDKLSFPTPGTPGNDRLFGRSGDDVVQGFAGDDRLTGDKGNDRLGGGAGDDVIKGGAGRDIAWGGFGADSVNTGTGEDIIAGDLLPFVTPFLIMRDYWTSADPYLDRIAAIREIPEPVAGFADGDRDVLVGGGGLDWYITSDPDVIRGLKTAEIVDIAPPFP